MIEYRVIYNSFIHHTPVAETVNSNDLPEVINNICEDSELYLVSVTKI